MGRLLRRFLVAVLAVAVAAPGWAQSEAPTYSKEQLDQLLAPIALYPDSLLAQVLMAATYPAQVAEAVSWSAAHPNDKGDAAVTKAESLGWEPSVTSLVAFPRCWPRWGRSPNGCRTWATPSWRSRRTPWTRCSACARRHRPRES